MRKVHPRGEMENSLNDYFFISMLALIYAHEKSCCRKNIQKL